MLRVREGGTICPEPGRQLDQICLRFPVLEPRAACALQSGPCQKENVEMRSVVVAGAISIATVISGCTVHTRGTAEPVGTTYVTSAPVRNYDGYPNTVYEGRTVYYVNDRWGYPQQDRWVYYRNEPPPLVRYRTNVRQAPPARPVEVVRPAPNPPPRSAPPATRVR